MKINNLPDKPAGAATGAGKPVDRLGESSTKRSEASAEDVLRHADLALSEAKADQAANAEMQKVQSGMALPPGFKLPF